MVESQIEECVLDFVREHAPVNVSQIARACGFNITATSMAVNILQQKGLLFVKANQGRKLNMKIIMLPEACHAS